MSEPLETLVNEIRRDAEKIERDIEALKARREELAVALRVIEARSATKPVDRAEGRPKDMAETGPYSELDFPTAVQRLLQNAPEPMSSGDIAKALLAGGYQTTSSNFPNITRSSLARLFKQSPELGLAKVGVLWALSSR